MFLFPPVLFGEPRLVVYEEMHGAHWNMVLVYVSLLLLRPPVSRALWEWTCLWMASGHFWTPLEMPQGDLRGWLHLHLEVAGRGTGRSLPQESATEGTPGRQPITQCSSKAPHNCTRLTFTAPVLLVGNRGI